VPILTAVLKALILGIFLGLIVFLWGKYLREESIAKVGLTLSIGCLILRLILGIGLLTLNFAIHYIFNSS